MNFDLLRPVVFAELKVGDKICNSSSVWSCPTVKYKAPLFAVLGFNDGSEDTWHKHRLEETFKFPPLCWVEGKPVYPGDGPLYYEDNPAWRHNEEGVFASGVRDDELHFHGGIAFPIDTATWTKPKRVPSFQVEGVDVYPGDTVYYYGVNEEEWGELHTVKENGRVVWRRTGHVGLVNQFDGGAKAFRLKPQLVIGDLLVPMPEREAPTERTTYYTPNPHGDSYYSQYSWWDAQADRLWLKRGLVHLTKEAAIAHGEALVALSKKKD